MEMRQLSVFVVLGSLTTVSMASYELAMFTNGSLGISRYDPVNRVSLGTFGTNSLGQYSGPVIGTDPLRPGRLSVFNGDGAVRIFNYSTGILTGQFGTVDTTYYGNGPLRFTAMTNGNYAITGYSGASPAQKTRILTTGGSLISTLSPFGSLYFPLSTAQGTDNRIYQLVRYDLSGGNYAYYSFVFDAVGSYQGYNDLGTVADANAYGNVVAANGRVYYSSGAGTSSLNFKWHPNGASQTVSGLSGYNYFITNGWTNMVVGHNGNLHLIQSSYNGTNYTNRWYTYDAGTNYMSVNHQMASTEYIGSLAMVIAPEPATWGALALGSLVLIRRRKKG